jgi:hypothetical protein
VRIKLGHPLALLLSNALCLALAISVSHWKQQRQCHPLCVSHGKCLQLFAANSQRPLFLLRLSQRLLVYLFQPVKLSLVKWFFKRKRLCLWAPYCVACSQPNAQPLVL